MEREGVGVFEEIKKYLELLALRVKAKRFVEKWDRILSERVMPSLEGFAEKSVREDRESH